MTIACYSLSAFRNPGYVLGGAGFDSANVGAYNPNLERKEIITDVMALNGGARKGFHQRKTSVLTKGLQISRHERNKSKSGVNILTTSE